MPKKMKHSSIVLKIFVNFVKSIHFYRSAISNFINDRQTDRWMDGWMDGWMDEWMVVWMNGWVDGWTER